MLDCYHFRYDNRNSHHLLRARSIRNTGLDIYMHYFVSCLELKIMNVPGRKEVDHKQEYCQICCVRTNKD